MSEIVVKDTPTGPDAPVKDAGVGTPFGAGTPQPGEGGDFGGFKTMEELLAHVKELEAKVPTLNEEKEPDTEPFIVAGKDMTTFATEWAEKGELSPESYAALAAQGFPKTLVDAYIQGQKATMNQQKTLEEDAVKSIKAVAGGEDGFTALAGWMRTNLSTEEIQEYNALIEMGNPKVAQLAVSEMVAKMQNAEGKAPTLIRGAKSTGAPAPAFRSMAEITAAMRDPRYANDSAYRRDVEERVARCNLF